MKGTILVFLFIILSSAKGLSQSVTTFILVRHAEKATDQSKDPELSVAGKQRADRLTEMLKATKIDAIYSTSYKRTQSTVASLAQLNGLPLNSYQPLKPEAIDEMLQKFPGGTIVVCGHSNTIPWTANYLSGKTEVKDFEDGEYGNLLIVEVVKRGEAKLIWLKY